MISIKKKLSNPLILGTLILTLTGLISRLIGFYYRIYLTKLFGEEGMGIYQLISPMLALSFSLCAAGFQTAISKIVAEGTANQNNKSPLISMYAAAKIVLPLSLLCNFLIFTFSDFISENFLFEKRCSGMLKILSFTIVPSALHACINGYFYGKRKALIPSVTQLIEQLARVGSVFLITSKIISKNELSSGNFPIEVAVWGLLIGEIISFVVAFITIISPVKNDRYCKKASTNDFTALLHMVIPLTANRITINLLQSVETVSIPAKLKLFGYNTETALSIYGVLTGMAMPLIFFPNALTSAVSVLLLPTVSKANASGNENALKKLVSKSIKLGLSFGLLIGIFFIAFGGLLGEFLFSSTLAGNYIRFLGFICPYMYLNSILSSILQGFGKTARIFFINCISLLCRLGFIFILVPRIEIYGYLLGLGFTQLLSTILLLNGIKKPG